MLQQIATGGAQSLLGVARYDNDFAEGQAGELRIGIRQIPFFPDLPPGFVGALNLALKRAPGLELTGPVRFDNGILFIPFRRGPAPLILIAVVLGVFFVGAILLLVTGWSLFREPFEKILVAGAEVGEAVAEIGKAAADIGKGIAENADKLVIGGLVLAGIFLLTKAAEGARK